MAKVVVPRITDGKMVLDIKKLPTRPHVWETASLKRTLENLKKAEEETSDGKFRGYTKKLKPVPREEVIST